MRQSSLAFALSLTLLAGCNRLPPLFQPASVVMTDGNAELRIQTRVISGGFATMAVMKPYTQQDIDHVVLSLHAVVGGTESPVKDALGKPVTLRLPGTALAKAVAFSRLKSGHTYRVKAEAFRSADDSERISVSGDVSPVDVIVTNDDRPTLADLKITLIDRLFNGQATASGIAVTPGGLAASGKAGVTLLKGILETLAGNGTSGFINGNGTTARFYYPEGIAVDASGNVYVADTYNHAIRKITPTGTVSTFAGNGTSGFTNGNGTTARFKFPYGIALDASGKLYVADSGNDAIRVITPGGDVSTLAVDAYPSPLQYPYAIARDAEGNFHVPASGGYIRKFSPQGQVLGYYDIGDIASALAFDAAGNLYATIGFPHKIKKRTPQGAVSTLAGSGNQGYEDATGVAASFNSPGGIAVDAWGYAYVADYGNEAIRKISPTGVVTTVVTGIPSPRRLAITASGKLLVISENHSIRTLIP